MTGTRPARQRRNNGSSGENEEDLKLLERVADAVVATGLALAVGAKPGTKLNEAYGDLAVALGRAFPTEGEGDEAMLEAILKRGLTPTVETDYERWHHDR